MPFSFNPGQEQTSQPETQQENGVPLLVVPEAPTITLTAPVEVISPLAYKNRSKSKFGVYFQSGIFVILGIMVIASIGLFSYQSTLKIQIENRKSKLIDAQKNFVEPNLEDILRLSSRLSLINKIMNERASVSTALKIVEESVNNPVVYNKFSLAKSKKDNYYDLSFGGETNSYNALYQQVEVLKSTVFAGAFPKISISGIGPLDKKGIASFKVDASVAIAGIDPDGFSILDKIKGSTTTPVVATTTTQQIPTQVASSSLPVVASSSKVLIPVTITSSTKASSSVKIKP